MKELYQVGITLIPGIGDINAKNIITYCGSAEAVFKEKKQALEKIPGVGSLTARSISTQNVLSRAEKELGFIEKNNISTLFYLDSNYPQRLTHCADSPVILYYKGDADLNHQKVISVVGTRNATEYGKAICRELIQDLKQYDVLIASGLAYGIDVCAHKSCVEHQIPTVGVLAHGLDRLYPAVHKKVAVQMLEGGGGLLTDFMSETVPDRENFPSRNRIVAGMADATIIVESASRGGALITAEIANSYSRDVFAVPGRIGDKYAAGCHYLIKANKAALISGATDIVKMMGWDQLQPAVVQKQMFVELSAEEQQLSDVLQEHGESSIDFICTTSQMPMSKVAAVLLNMEFSGVVKGLPGKRYQLI